jgi:hypothetical protein
MTEPFAKVDTAMNSDCVEKLTMSFSLCAVVAEHPEKQNPAQQAGPGDAFLQSTGRLGCSGCTPAEPYPPNRANKHTRPARANQSKNAAALRPRTTLPKITTTQEIAFYP